MQTQKKSDVVTVYDIKLYPELARELGLRDLVHMAHQNKCQIEVHIFPSGTDTERSEMQ